MLIGIELVQGFVLSLWHVLLGLRVTLKKLIGTRDYGFFILDCGIIYIMDEDPTATRVKLLGWIDFDWAGGCDSRRSTIGYRFILGLHVVS